MRSKIALALRIILGILFIVSAYSKIISPGLIEIILVDHGIAGTRESAATLVRILIGFEFALGLLFFQPFSIKRLVIPTAFLFLAGFTIYLAYTGFILKDTQNCGCFGEMIKMSPIESIIKNIALMSLLVLLFKLSSERKKYYVPLLLIVAAIGLTFIIVPARSQKDIKFANYTTFVGQGRVDLSQGDKLIAIMNTDCDHCQQLAKELAALKKNKKSLPEIYTLFFIEGSISVDSFRAITKYDLPYRKIEVKEFLNLIGQSPPRVYWLREGAVKEIWDKDILENITEKYSWSLSRH